MLIKPIIVAGKQLYLATLIIGYHSVSATGKTHAEALTRAFEAMTSFN